MNKQNYNKKNLIRLIAFIIFIILLIVITILAIPFIKNMMTQEGRDKIQDIVSGAGMFGPILFLLFQAIQVIIAFIPGEPFEIVGGILFGAWGGLLFCLAGILLGTIAVYLLVKKIGYPIVSAFVGEDKLDQIKIFNDEKKLELLTFILFLIPGTPKDMLTYLVPLTKINPKKYFLYSTLARIPSVIMSTYVGQSLNRGQWLTTIIIFSVTLAIGLVGILVNDKFMSKIKHIKKDK